MLLAIPEDWKCKFSERGTQNGNWNEHGEERNVNDEIEVEKWDKNDKCDKIKMIHAAAKCRGNEIFMVESSSAGNLSLLACRLFTSFSILIFDFSRSFLMAFALSTFTFQLSFTLVLFVVFAFNVFISVVTILLFLFSLLLSLYLFEKWFPHEEKSPRPGLLFRFGPSLCLINMYVATILVTNAMMGFLLSFS